MAKTPEQLLVRLQDLGIDAETVEHAPIFTVEESQKLRDSLPSGRPGGPGGGHSKNLFLRNKRKQMWLVTLEENRQVDLKVLGDRLEAGRFSFGSAERLMEHLGVIPGSVTPFAVINDPDNQVTMVLDKALLDHDKVHFHPLTNAATTMLSPQDLLRFLEAEGHGPILLDL